MRRVSSRQRLVSWDAFDATVIEPSELSSSEEDEASTSDYATAVSAIESTCSVDAEDKAAGIVGRKRDRKSFRAEQRLSNRAVSGHKEPSVPVDKPAVTSILPITASSQTVTVPTTIVPCYSWEVPSSIKNSTSNNTLSSFASTLSALPSPISESLPDLTFDQLMNDVHFAVFSFLDLPSLRSVMALNSDYRHLVLSEDARSSLWTSHCERAWNMKSDRQQQMEGLPHSPTKWLDRFHLPTAVAAPDTTNLPLLLSMTKEFPTGVDSELVNAQNLRTERLRRRETRPILRSMASLEELEQNGPLRQYESDTGRPLVQYTGPIGVGDRCIRSNLPLPRPKQDIATSGRQGPSVVPHASDQQRYQHSSRAFFNLLRRSASKMVNTKDAPSLSERRKPFVMPFLENSTTLNVTPRLISYYEVTILDVNGDNAEKDDDDDDIPGPPPTSHVNGNRSDCVAVGIATESFHVHSRMPGWDKQSFGYHGDDGGIFHSSGGMVKQFGPTFGAGDTIGCGVDYVNQGIFFTLNGKFLGYGWKEVDEELLRHDLYPVVGLDTNCPLFLNFGAQEPFAFDLSSFLMKHEDVVTAQYSLEKLATTKACSGAAHTSSLRSVSSASSLASSNSSTSTTSTSRRRRFLRRNARDRK